MKSRAITRVKGRPKNVPLKDRRPTSGKPSWVGLAHRRQDKTKITLPRVNLPDIGD